VPISGIASTLFPLRIVSSFPGLARLCLIQVSPGSPPTLFVESIANNYHDTAPVLSQLPGQIPGQRKAHLLGSPSGRDTYSQAMVTCDANILQTMKGETA